MRFESLLLPLVVSMFSLVGCGPTTPKGPTITFNVPQDEKDFTLRMLNEYNMTRFDNAEDRINFIYDDGTQDMAVGADIGPNIIAFHSDKILPLYIEKKISTVPEDNLKELDELMSDKAMESANLLGMTLGYPYEVSHTAMLFYNSDYVTASQASDIYSLVDAAKSTNKKISYPLKEVYYGGAALFTFGASYVILMSSSGHITDVQATFDEEVGFKAAKALVDLLRYAGDTLMTDINRQDAPDGENIIATIASSSSVTNYVELVGDSLKMSKLPNITYNKEKTDEEIAPLDGFTSFNLYAVNPKASDGDLEILELCHDIAMYLVSEEVQNARYLECDVIPTHLTSQEEVKDVDSVNAIIEQNTVAEIHSVVPSDFWTAPSDFFDLICEQYETISDEEIREALITLNIAVENSR